MARSPISDEKVPINYSVMENALYSALPICQTVWLVVEIRLPPHSKKKVKISSVIPTQKSSTWNPNQNTVLAVVVASVTIAKICSVQNSLFPNQPGEWACSGKWWLRKKQKEKILDMNWTFQGNESIDLI